MSAHRETIFALSSGVGRAGIAVVRMSGPASAAAIERLTGRAVPRPRVAALRRLADPATGAPIDEALVLWFPGPRSETGEDTAEFHVHGAPTVVDALLAALAAVPGSRPAGPGEFTRRAFDNGKLDLTAVEGLADLVAAETEAQRRQALRQMSGALGDLYEGWRSRLLRILAHAEAAIDFPDEDLPDETFGAVLAEVPALAAEIARHLDDEGRGERLRDGFRIAIVGAPNVGKSSILNQLAKRDVAIVTDIAGTTRDVVEVHLDLGGFPVTVADTAGLREAADEVEAEGVRRTRLRAAEADLRLAVFDATRGRAADPETAALVDDDTLILINKTDLSVYKVDAGDDADRILAVSARTGAGFDRLIERVSAMLRDRMSMSETPGLTRARHRDGLKEALGALDRARTAALPELAAEDLRLAARALGRLTGRVDVEEILDVIFRDFCIGK